METCSLFKTQPQLNLCIWRSEFCMEVAQTVSWVCCPPHRSQMASSNWIFCISKANLGLPGIPSLMNAVSRVRCYKQWWELATAGVDHEEMGVRLKPWNVKFSWEETTMSLPLRDCCARPGVTCVCSPADEGCVHRCSFWSCVGTRALSWWDGTNE